MKIYIQKVSNNPSNTLLEVYAQNTRPVCKIYEEDFIEGLTDKQIEQLENGKYEFNVDGKFLFDRCKTWFGL